MNVAIISARGGSKSIPLKNLREVCGKPLVVYPAEAADKAKLVDHIFIDTDNTKIALAVAGAVKVKPLDALWRPPHLQGDDVNHGDVIKDAVERVKWMLPELQNVVVLLGNCVAIDADLIDKSLDILMTRPGVDSVMSVWQAQDDHPYRALTRNGAGTLVAFGDTGPAHTSRQSYPPVYFYDQGVWTFRWQCVQEKGPIRPWWWMGHVCIPFIRPWVTGHDVHTELDIEVSEWWVRRMNDNAEG